MSAQPAKNQIARFLSSDIPEVLCISGDWGTGKTFTFQKIFEDCFNKDAIVLKRYAYVSLFGQSSMDGVKQTIFENTDFLVRSDDEMRRQAIDFGNGALQAVKKGRNILGALPYVGGYLEKALNASAAALFATVRNQIICVDDFERKSDNLPSKDLLGLISFLKEQRGCKIIMLLNDKKIPEDDKDFGGLQEKVVDRFVRFNPTPQECAEIALDQENDIEKKVAEFCIKLQIANIRIIRRILIYVHEIIALIPKDAEKIRHQALHSIVVLAWCKLDPKNAPDLDFIQGKERRLYSYSKDAPKLTEEQARWARILRDYGFFNFDSFDEVLHKGVQDGFFDAKAISDQIDVLQTDQKRGEGDRLMAAAWDLYRFSFHDNSDKVVAAMISAIEQESIISLGNLSAAITFVRNLGRDSDAETMIQKALKHKRDPAYWDYKRYTFPVILSDESFREALDVKIEETKVYPQLGDIVRKVGGKNGWSEDELEAMSLINPDDIVAMLKESEGEELSELLSGFLSFTRVANPSPVTAKINENIRKALDIIGQESPINRLRADGYLHGAR